MSIYRKFKFKDSLARNMFSGPTKDHCQADEKSEVVYEYLQKVQVQVQRHFGQKYVKQVKYGQLFGQKSVKQVKIWTTVRLMKHQKESMSIVEGSSSSSKKLWSEIC